MAWEQFIARINLLGWYHKGFQASIQQNPVSSFLHCLFKVTCYPIVCSMSELDSPLTPSCKTFLLQARRSYFKKSSKSSKLYVLRKITLSLCSVYLTSLLLSQYYLSVRIFVFVFISHSFAEMFVLRRRKTIPLVGVSQPYVSRANLLRHTKRQQGCGTILRG